jgi:hypothetical protein
MTTDNKRCLISTDGIIFREATPEEIKAIELREEGEQAKRTEELKKELPLEVKFSIESIIKKLEDRLKEDDEILSTLEKHTHYNPYRNFGYLAFREASGYLEDTISDLKELIFH